MDGITQGAKVRVTGAGKLEYLNRPLQKLYSLDLSVGNVSDKREEVKDVEHVKGKNQNEKRAKNSVEVRNPRRNTRQSRSKGCTLLHTKLMLDYA